MVKYGIMSFAHVHAPGYASCIQQLSNAELVTIWDEEPKRGRDAAKQFGVKFVGDMDKFLASDIDAVVITSENMKHCEQVIVCAKAGKHVLCEKPLAAFSADARAMIQACEKAGVQLGTAFPCRYIPAMQELKRAIDAGLYGDLYMASCTNNGSYPGGWFSQVELSGGGATMDHTVHVADLLRWMTGKEVVKVYCENGQQVHKDIGTDDTGVIHLEFEDGFVATIVASWNRAKSFATWGDVTMEFVGEKGVAYADAFNQKFDLYSDAMGKGVWAFWGDNMDLGLLTDFTTAIEEGRAPSITGHDGLKASEITEAAYKAVAKGQAISLK